MVREIQRGAIPLIETHAATLRWGIAPMLLARLIQAHGIPTLPVSPGAAISFLLHALCAMVFGFGLRGIAWDAWRGKHAQFRRLFCAFQAGIFPKALLSSLIYAASATLPMVLPWREIRYAPLLISYLFFFLPYRLFDHPQSGMLPTIVHAWRQFKQNISSLTLFHIRAFWWMPVMYWIIALIALMTMYRSPASIAANPRGAALTMDILFVMMAWVLGPRVLLMQAGFAHRITRED
jgi:hypothetical protein